MSTPQFTVEAFHNGYLPEGGSEVDAIVSVTASGLAGTAGTATTEAAEVVMIDCSGSMGDPATKIAAARRATRAAIDALPDGVLLAVVAGRHDARMVFPQAERMVVLDRVTRRQAHAAVDHLTPSGGTAIGTWLRLAQRLLAPHPRRLRHAIMLTDGKDEHETPEDLAAALQACDGVFTCDARGVGTDWVVQEVRGIAQTLLGTADIVAEPEHLAADFEGIVERAMGRGVGDVALRVWAPRGATVRSVKQVSPTVEDLTDRRTPDPAKPLIGLYPTGSWGDETREYHVRIALDPLAVGEEILAARIGVAAPSLAEAGGALAETRVPVTWTGDSALATRLNRRVAHYTGQAELAEAIQEGLDARRAGDLPTATARLGRAVALAAESGNAETSALLEKVVEVQDPATGRVRLRREVAAADEMTLDVRSTRTARVREGS
ncbi:vWA domain-containing protein [Actinomycetospora termitidis]|uniref:VWA domain-containing protein n=1 Tax=Actinomycetospora termitidis TaxID=3053470 RepID=A0ABT7MDT8_9PSEU|nr:VWA domain-containing protein [Actinomycetospora sp. Odt1-22]MDL5158830.1 VWA domain-containing protein [Actinomycetospora sp. Odt1-22]